MLFFLLVLFAIAPYCCEGVQQPPYGQLKVTNGQLVSSSGAAVTLRGMSLFWSQWDPKYWNADTVKQLKCKWNVNVLRAPLGVEGDGGYLQDATTNVNKLITVVDACIAAGIYVIIDWHYTSGTAYTTQAVAFFKQMASKYGGYAHVLYEVWNEPVGVSWTGVLKPYHQQLITAIRAIDSDNVIILGTPTYDMVFTDVVASPMSGYTNIMYALHFYAADGTAASHVSLQNQMLNMLAKKLAVFVTESGAGSGGSNAPVNMTIMNQWWTVLNNNKVSEIIWAVRGEGNYQNPLVTGTTSAQIGSDSSLTAYGKQLKAYFLSKNAALSGC